MTTEQAPTRKVRLGLYSPHKGQLKLHNSRARFRVSCWGRRAGKTFGCCNEHVKKGVERRRSLNWWVAPTYKQAEVAFETIVRAMRDQMTKPPNYTDLKFKLYSSEFEFRSAEKPDNLRGDGMHFLTIDECREIRARAWFEVMMPMLMDTDGEAVFISTPQGHDWFYQLYRYGQDPLEPDYWSFSAPSTINPYLDRKFIEDMRRKSPEDVFAQEILARFLANAATVFKRIDGCIINRKKAIQGDHWEEPPIPGHTYVLGWDPAKHQDFSVVTVLDCNTGRLACFDRDNKTDYRIQIIRVLALAFKYNHAGVIMDATRDDAILERLQESGLTVEGIVWTNLRKKEMVERLQLAIEHQQIKFPKIEILIDELRAYGYKISASRNIIYGAPEGKNDDCVSSLMMTVHAANLGGEIAIVRSYGGRTIEGMPETRNFDDDVEQGYIDEDQRKELERRQGNTGKILQSILSGRFGI
jgi:hypothetical protein